MKTEMEKEGELQHDVAHLKLDRASRKERARVLHRGRSVGGRMYSEKGPAREQASAAKATNRLGRF